MLSWELLGRGGRSGQNPQRSFPVYLHRIVKCLLTLISSPAGTSISVLMPNHGRADSPSNNKIIMVMKRATIILIELLMCTRLSKHLALNPHNIMWGRYCKPTRKWSLGEIKWPIKGHTANECSQHLNPDSWVHHSVHYWKHFPERLSGPPFLPVAVTSFS